MTDSDSNISTGDSPLLDSYQTIIESESIGWKTERPLIKCLGIGGQGIVYLSVREGADDFTLPVALKFFSPKRYEDIDTYELEMRRIARVAARTARIQQDHLIDVQDFIKHDGIHMMEMEWVDGFDLHRLLTFDTMDQVRDHVTDGRWRNLNKTVVTKGRERPRLKPGVAITVLRECLNGLAALHRNDIVHGDIKPSNIMIKRTGNVKIIDIGSAFEIRDTPTGHPCTPAYAPPEVLLGDRGSPQSDLASLGYVLLEMIAGAQPFTDLEYADLVEARKNILERLPQLLPTEEFAYIEPLTVLIRGLVHPDPAQRFASAEDAEFSDDGAAGFHRLLVKGDMESEYENEIRHWIEEVETKDDDPQKFDDLDSTKSFSAAELDENTE
ncbi:MAG: protein kinase [Planctomycetaceae bacterium]|nr:protein kinase [Planctomycetaceae bacterium]